MKKTASVPSAGTSGPAAALIHGDQAAGAQHLRPGVAFEPAHDLEFALGFPHFRLLLDGHPDDAKAAAVAKNSIQSVTSFGYRLSWPREVAMRIARAGASSKVRIHKWTPDADRVVSREGPIGRDEAAKLLSALLKAREPLNPAGKEVAYIVEAVLGPDATAEMMIDSLEQMEKPPHFGGVLVKQLGFVLHRVAAGSAASHRARLQAVFDRWTRTVYKVDELPPIRSSDMGHSAGLRGLDIVLHGRVGAERSLVRVQSGLDIHGVEHVVDDAAFVEKMVMQEMTYPSAMRWVPDARLAFLGGPSVVDHYRRRISGLKLVADQKYVVATFGRIRSPSVVRLMLAMSATTKATTEAFAWLKAHAEYATPVLQQIAAAREGEAEWVAPALAQMR